MTLSLLHDSRGRTGFTRWVISGKLISIAGYIFQDPGTDEAIIKRATIDSSCYDNYWQLIFFKYCMTRVFLIEY